MAWSRTGIPICRSCCDTDRETLQGFIADWLQEPGSTQLNIGAMKGYRTMSRSRMALGSMSGVMLYQRHREAVCAGTVYHYMSPKHLARYAWEFTGRQNDRLLSTAEQLRRMFQAMEGKQLRYQDLVA